VKDIIRFFREMTAIDWTHVNLVFLDEVSFANRGMLRRRGFVVKVSFICKSGLKRVIKTVVRVKSYSIVENSTECLVYFCCVSSIATD